jgi:1-acyl-sn-glycerol-3-phosphate acyltransferase
LRANQFFAQTYHSLEVVGESTLPSQGPAIIICNHISGLDPPLIQSAFPRLITWMMAREYYEKKALRWFFEMVGAIPVDRGGRDLAATRAALRALAAGKVLGVFPEGRIEQNSKLLPFQTGVAMMALRMKVDVIPCYLDGSQRGSEMLEACLKRQQAKLVIGQKLRLDALISNMPDLESAIKLLEHQVFLLRQSLETE